VAIVEAAALGDVTVCAWGTHGRRGDRSVAVVKLLREAGVRPHCLRIGKAGEPCHPLRERVDLRPVLLEGERFGG
jgi:hypothetical protein